MHQVGKTVGFSIKFNEIIQSIQLFHLYRLVIAALHDHGSFKISVTKMIYFLIFPPLNKSLIWAHETKQIAWSINTIAYIGKNFVTPQNSIIR